MLNIHIHAYIYVYIHVYVTGNGAREVSADDGGDHFYATLADVTPIKGSLTTRSARSPQTGGLASSSSWLAHVFIPLGLNDCAREQATAVSPAKFV